MLYDYINMKQSIKTLFETTLNKKIRSITKIENGFNNENYLINDAYVIRIPKDNKDETITFTNELASYKAIENLKVSEKILYFDTNSGIKISKFVHNTREYVNTPTNEQITYVAKTLKKLHNSEVKVNFGYQMFFKLKVYKENLSSSVYIDEKIERKIINQVKSILSKDKMVMCHNDLVKNNLLFKNNGGLVLIDWEYSSMNNPYFDLASFISENNLNETQEEFFLSKYFGSKLNLTKRKRTKIFINFLDLLFYYWALYLFKKRGDRIYHTIALEKLNRILKEN